MTRACWDELPEAIREAIYRNAGAVSSAELVNGGSAEIALVLSTESGRSFLKGVRDERRARVELRVQPFLPPLAPRLCWHAEAAGYLLMAFEYVAGRHANLSPGSPDLPKVAAALTDLSGSARPCLPVLPVEQRWAAFSDRPESLAAIVGSTLVHTDLTGENVIIGDQVKVIDWAWPSRGASWLDTGAMVARLIQAGHDPDQAEDWAATVPAWRAAPRDAVVAYAQLRAFSAKARGARIAKAWDQYLSYVKCSRFYWHRFRLPGR